MEILGHIITAVVASIVSVAIVLLIYAVRAYTNNNMNDSDEEL